MSRSAPASDRLINGHIGTAKHIETKEKEISTIYLALDDNFTGRTRINGNDSITKNNRWVPTERGGVNVRERRC